MNHSIDSLYSTNSVNVYVPSDNQQFRYKLREGGKYFNGFLTEIVDYHWVHIRSLNSWSTVNQYCVNYGFWLQNTANISIYKGSYVFLGQK